MWVPKAMFGMGGFLTIKNAFIQGPLMSCPLLPRGTGTYTNTTGITIFNMYSKDLNNNCPGENKRRGRKKILAVVERY